MAVAAALSTADDAPRHTAVVLFYKYFLTAEFPVLRQYEKYYEERLLASLKSLCQRLELKGRLLISAEGVNGSLSAASMEVLDEYIKAMETFDLIRECGEPSEVNNRDTIQEGQHKEYIFQNVDWKKSSDEGTHLPEPFPDLKVSIVKEIISSGGSVTVDEIPEHGGTHLTPKEFHRIMVEEDVVLVDVRSAYEVDIGHFIHPKTNQPAINPQIAQFSSFDDMFCAKQAEELKDKKVLMYCTGGIRCEKASVMLKRRGVQDVSQLSGGIHRYLEEFGEEGCFRGKNFVFDQRIAMTPSECQESFDGDASVHEIVGRCVDCSAAYDELSGSRICTVCRDLVLVCPPCQDRLREFHCRRHQDWKNCYFTFLEAFRSEQLAQQRTDLLALREPVATRNVRRTLMRQVEKIDAHTKDLESGVVEVDHEAARRCRTCMEPRSQCDGNCWGFWKAAAHREANETTPPIESIHVGEIVEPGPNWNNERLGSSSKDDGGLRRGRVVEVKPWGSGDSELDCVVVAWNTDSIPSNRRSDNLPQLYRCGVIALDGSRMYDVQRVKS